MNHEKTKKSEIPFISTSVGAEGVADVATIHSSVKHIRIVFHPKKRKKRKSLFYC